MIAIKARDNNPLGLTPGETYVMDNALAADFLKAGTAGDDWQPVATDKHGTLAEKLKQGLLFEKPKVLIIRAGGMGDLLFLTASLALLMEQHPEVEFTLCTFMDYWPAIGHPKLDGLKLLAYPPQLTQVENYEAVVALEEVIESNHEVPAMQLLGQALGVEVPAASKPLLRISSAALAEAHRRFPKDHPGDTFIGLGLRAGHDSRTWPLDYIQATAQILMDRDPRCVVFFFGEKKAWEGMRAENQPRLMWLPDLDLSLEETLAVLGIMDGYIGPDSGLTHAAGALGIPTVGIFGPFQWQIRVPEGSSIRAVNGHLPCAPCHHLGRTSSFPPGMPCEKRRCCLALAEVKPDRVASLLLRQMRAGNPIADVTPEYPLQNLFGPVARRGDVHPELPRAELFHLGTWGLGAATVEEGQMLRALVLMLKPTLVLETGTETGWTAAWLASGLESNECGTLITLEQEPSMVELATQNLEAAGLLHRVTVVPEPALDWLNRQRDKQVLNPAHVRLVELALLDTHIHLRLEELRALTPLLAPGAFVCVHDTSALHPMRGDCQLLKDLREVEGFSVVHLPSPRGLTVLQWNGAEQKAR